MQPPPPVLEYGVSHRLSPAKLARRLAVQTILVIVGAFLCLMGGRLMAPKPVYRASSLLLITSIPSGLPLPPGTRALSPSEIPATGQSIRDALNTPAYRQRVVNRLKQTAPADPAMSADQLAKILSIDYVRDTTLFKVEATHASPIKSAQIDNIAADEAVKQFRGTAPSLTLMSIATPPVGPSNDPGRFILIAGLAGGVLLPTAMWVFRQARGKAI